MTPRLAIPTVFAVDVPPPDNSVVMPGTRFGVNVTANDNDAVSRVEYRLNGEVAAEATSAPWDTTVLVPATFPDGIHQLTAQAFDRSGHRSDIRTRTLVTDGTPPAIAFAGPGLVRTQASSYGVTFTVADLHLDRTTCVVTDPAGNRQTLGACPVSGTVSLAMPSLGTWKLTVSAVDRASNRAEEEVTVIREATPDPGAHGVEVRDAQDDRRRLGRVEGLALARGQQTTKPGWAARFMETMRAKKAAKSK